MSGKMLFRTAIAVLAAGGAIYGANRFLLKPAGPIEIAGGFGLDDIAQGAAAVGGIMLVHRILKGG